MDDKPALKARMAALLEIPGAQIKVPHHIPVNVYVEEADELYLWCKEDKEALTAVGLSWEQVEELPQRADLLREAQALWAIEQLTDNNARKEWAATFPKAMELYNDMFQTAAFAFRNDKEAKHLLGSLKSKRRIPFQIQAFNNLVVLLEKETYRDLLAAVNFDRAKLQQAEAFAETLGLLHARVSSVESALSEGLDLRNRAYTHLKEIVDSIRRYGKYVFAKNPERLVGYRSAHLRKKSVQQIAQRAAKKHQPAEKGDKEGS